MTTKLLLLPGDGIGPEVMSQVERIITWFNQNGTSFETETDLVGGSAYEAHGQAISDETMAKAKAADAVIFGAVGGEQWANVPYKCRPEAGLFRLRKDMELFANLRPAVCFDELADASSLKKEIVKGLDILIVRELTGGIYFGEPRGITDLENGQKRGFNTQVYDTYEIERVTRVAFDLAKLRNSKVTSVEKHNVMESGLLWKDVASKIHQEEYPNLALGHMLADNCAMQLVRAPKQFDVIVTDNLFGDILSDIAAMLTGSLGMLPSASLGAEVNGKLPALYEPVHGSAPDIAGKGVANPIATILSFGMALKYSFKMEDKSKLLESAIQSVLANGLRTADIAHGNEPVCSTIEMGDAIIIELEKNRKGQV